MPQGLYAETAGRIGLRDVPLEDLAPKQVRVRTALAAIKHGTTFHLFSGASPFHARRFDKERRIFVEREAGAAPGDMNACFVGNMIVGTVESVGREVRSIRPGERVFAYGPACDLVTLNEGSVERLPDG